MTWVSANTPYYFKPAVIENPSTATYYNASGEFTQESVSDPIPSDTYISGDSIALSPALYSYYYAVNNLNKSPSDIRVVSVGATNELPSRLDNTTSLLEWTERLA